MIKVHKLNGSEVVINAELIEALEPRGTETVVCLATGNKYVVCEPVEEVARLAVEYRRSVNAEAAAVGKPANPTRGFVRENP
jgi:uncharacterized protein YlzI (FlbEa/FlbD family)